MNDKLANLKEMQAKVFKMQFGLMYNARHLKGEEKDEYTVSIRALQSLARILDGKIMEILTQKKL